jgi:hypothetical protein
METVRMNAERVERNATTGIPMEWYEPASYRTNPNDMISCQPIAVP